MHQLAPEAGFAMPLFPQRKKILDRSDLTVVADLICEGLRQGLYLDVLRRRKRADVVRFLHQLSSRCEFQQFDAAEKRARVRVASLVIYCVRGAVVGFVVLAEAISDSIDHGIELIMMGIVSTQRGLGYGAAILDETIRHISQSCFSLMARCPTDNNLLFAMLVSRGFVSIGRCCNGYVLQLEAGLSRGVPRRPPQTRFVE